MRLCDPGLFPPPLASLPSLTVTGRAFGVSATIVIPPMKFTRSRSHAPAKKVLSRYPGLAANGPSMAEMIAAEEAARAAKHLAWAIEFANSNAPAPSPSPVAPRALRAGEQPNNWDGSIAAQLREDAVQTAQGVKFRAEHKAELEALGQTEEQFQAAAAARRLALAARQDQGGSGSGSGYGRHSNA